MPQPDLSASSRAPEATPSAPGHLYKLIYVALAGVFLAVTAIGAVTLWLRHDDAVDTGRKRAENLALILGDHLRRSANAIDTTLTQLVIASDRLGGPKAPRTVWQPVLAAAQSGLPGTGSLSILDENGVITASTMDRVVGQSRKDLFIYKELLRDPAAGLVADPPFASPVTGRMLMPLGRRISNSDGSFAGVVVATLVPEELTAFYRSVDVGPRGMIWVLHPEGQVLFREPALRKVANETGGDNPIVRAQQAHPGSGDLQGALGSDGAVYYSAYRDVADPPLIVAVSLAQRDVLANWYSEAMVIGGIVVVVGIALLLAGLFIGREARARETVHDRLKETYVALNAAAEQGRQADAELRANQARFQAIMDYAPVEVALKDLDGRYTFVNRAFERRAGRRSEDIIGKTVADLFNRDFAELHSAVEREVVATRKIVQRELSSTEPTGSRSILIVKFPLFDGRGAVEAVGSIATETTELRRAESQLAHAQKMEAVGHLTGGIAHDFNNLLTVILGNAELLVEQAGGQERVLAEVMMQAAERGAELTRHLLAFGRRQVLEPRLIDVNQLVVGMEKLLRRTLDERIAIEVRPGDDLWRTTVDPGQLETAILNLAVNSRDAMPDGGRITIVTSNTELDDSYTQMNPEVTPGEYVMVAVEDSGAGMPPEVAQRVFEPFFTTKGVGKGTGLGLSMVYGFVKQSGGHVKIYSEVGIGTVIKLFLPRTVTDAAAAETRAAPDVVPKGTETILLVEDDPLVRRNTESQLKTLGYNVVTAENAAAALALVSDEFMPDLMLTDVIMPGMNGRELAEALHARWPALKVLFTSGYAHGTGVELVADSHFIGKPFRRRDLAIKVREILDGAAAASRRVA